MKFKRMALVAAAAVAGPTVLAATPAMAADQPAVIVPDTAPKEDAAPATDGAPAAQQQDQAKPAPVAPTAPTGSPAAEPAPKAAETPKAPQAPQAPKAPQAEKSGETEIPLGDELPDSMLMGPEVTVQGIPKDGFPPGGGWTDLTVKVDNSGHIAVKNYVPHLSVMELEGRFKASQIKVEYRAAGQSGAAWKSAAPIQSEEMGPGIQYDLGQTPSIAPNAKYSLDVRIGFAADIAVLPFEIYTDGSSTTAAGVAHSPASWYTAKIVGAEDGEEIPMPVEGPALTVNGVPKGGFTAGADWRNLSIHVDNTGKQRLGQFDLALIMARPDWVSMESSQIALEVYSKDAQGKKGWHKADFHDEDGVFFGFDLAGGAVEAGQSFDVQVRVRFAADAPTGDLTLGVAGWATVDEDTGEYAESHSDGILTKIKKAGTDTIPEIGPDEENQHTPDGDSKPIDRNPGGTGGTGGELAATGSSPATSWALGAGGVALAMGAALVAGTGRRRRPTA
ncbi:hypothetical protein [Streptomyces sp. WM4235]|uniref:hypothetical protein n=1 Tax=Streptomyces sp. WM4235 TaxID=1415551 RepID=UPI00131BAF6C|nr:hypothetical protein [Streptomyces sp. WM4235]